MAAFHSNLGWLYYGILKSDQTLIVVNVIGAVLQSLYIVVYFHYTKQKVSLFTFAEVCCVHACRSASLCLCVSELGDVPNFSGRDGPVLRLALLQHVSTCRRHSTQPARVHLQRGHRQHVPVPTLHAGTAPMHHSHTTYIQHTVCHLVYLLLLPAQK